MDRPGLSAAFATALETAADEDGPASLIGLEQEYRVFAGPARVDFRELIHAIALDGRSIDARDPNAYRCASGGAITADGREAEFAAPPIRVRPGFGDALATWSRIGRSTLARALPDGLRLDGYSTHLSAATPDRLAVRVAQLYVRTFAPSLLLLTDGPGSPGVLVRPRTGRLELGIEHADGDLLRAAGAFVVGSARACIDAIARRRPEGLPPMLVVEARPSRARFGWHVTPQSAGDDLHRGGGASLRLRAGGTIRAQDHLALAWASARRALGGMGADSDLAPVDALVGGRPARSLRGSLAVPSDDVFGPLLALPQRPGYTTSTVLLSWDFAIVRLSRNAHEAFACVPRRAIGRFLEQLRTGRLDELLLRYLELGAGHRRLRRPEQTMEAALYDSVATPSDLIPRERAPAVRGAVRKPGTRRDGRRLVAYGCVALVALVLLVLLALLASGGIGGRSAASSVPSTASGVVAPAGACTGPVKVIVDQFYPDGVQGGNATPPMFSTGGKRYCLTHLATYHWNGGAGAPDGGTFTLVDAGGRTVGGPWKAVATPATGGVLANWEADVTPTPFVIGGGYTLLDSDRSTLSWSKASSGAGFVRVWGTEYTGP